MPPPPVSPPLALEEEDDEEDEEDDEDDEEAELFDGSFVPSQPASTPAMIKNFVACMVATTDEYADGFGIRSESLLFLYSGCIQGWISSLGRPFARSCR